MKFVCCAHQLREIQKIILTMIVGKPKKNEEMWCHMDLGNLTFL